MNYTVKLYKSRDKFRFLIMFPFTILMVFISIVLGIIFGEGSINPFIVFGVMFLSGIPSGYINEFYFYQLHENIRINESKIYLGNEPIKLNTQLIFYYNNPEDTLSGWGLYASYIKYKSIKGLGRYEQLDKLIIDGEEFVVKIKSRKDVYNFKELIEATSELHSNTILYYSSDLLRQYHGEDYWEKR